MKLTPLLPFVFTCLSMLSFPSARGAHHPSVASVCNAQFSVETFGALGAFTNLSSTVGTASYFWEFGDGTTSDEEDPLHTYPESGLFLVILYVRDDSDGCTDSYEQWVSITKPGFNTCDVYLEDTIFNSGGNDLLQVDRFPVGCTLVGENYDVGPASNLPPNNSTIITSWNRANFISRVQYYLEEAQTTRREYYLTSPYNYSGTVNYDSCSANFEYRLEYQSNGALIRFRAMNEQAVSYEWAISGFGNPIIATTDTVSHFYPYAFNDTWLVKLEMEGPGGCVDQVTKDILVRNMDPLDTITQAQFVYPCLDSMATVCLDLDPVYYHPGNQYQWIDPAGIPVSLPSADSCFVISMASPADTGAYYCHITNPGIPNLDLTQGPVQVEVLEPDAVGGKYFLNEFIVEWVTGTVPGVKDSIRNLYSATVLDSCMCDFELWALPDSVEYPPGSMNYIVDDNDKKNKGEDEAGINSMDFNYLTESTGERSPAAASATGYSKPAPLPRAVPSGSPPTLVAVIDAGIDADHFQLIENFWTNTGESPGDDLDQDANCTIDDVDGFDYYSDDPAPLVKLNGHGTHVAGLVYRFANDGLATDEAVEIMNLRAFGTDGKGSLFDAICAIAYADTMGARVINLSWGYVGLPTSALRNVIARAGGDCGALVVASAGNEELNTDLMGQWHFPSNLGYSLENVLGVAATQTAETGAPLADYSNYGNSIDLALLGQLESTFPYDDFQILTGTSQSAAVMSGAAARLFFEYPLSTWLDVKTCLLSAAENNPEFNDAIPGNRYVDVADYNFQPNDYLGRALTCMSTIMTNPDCSVVSVGEVPGNTDRILSVNVFPNPSHHQVNFEFDEGKAFRANFRLFDGRGARIGESVWEIGPGQNIRTLDINRLPAGIYFFQIEWNGRLSMGRIVKK